MAISANSVWNIRASATGTAGKNGGFFVTGASGTNYSLQDGAQYALTGVTSVGMGNVILTASASADMVGNGLFVVSGTNFTINSWFEITSVSVGVSITLSTNAAGTAICTGAGASGVINIGGANRLDSTLADDMFESATAGNIYYIKSGSYTAGEGLAFAKDGTTSSPIVIRGYTTTQGDLCEGSDRPVLDMTTLALTLGSYWDVYNLSVLGTTTTIVTLGASNKFINCKVLNKSVTAARIGLTSGSNTWIYRCEFSSYRGIALNLADNSTSVIGCYVHSSQTGIRSLTTATHQNISGCVFVGFSSTGILMNASAAARVIISSNTFYGLNKTIAGVYGITASATGYGLTIINNIITRFAFGVYNSVSTYLTTGFDEYNNYHDNNADVNNWTKGSTATAVAPEFSSVTYISGATATTTSGEQLVQTGATFISSGVVAGRDFIYIESGTGVTVGFYGIASVISETQITTDVALAPNATPDKVFHIISGKNFSPGVGIKGLGGPRTHALAQTSNYFEQGASQRREKGTTVSAFIG